MSTRPKGHARLVTVVLDDLGLKYRVDTTRRHTRVYVRLPGGREKFIVASVSPSDYRSAKNKRAQVRRFLRAEGLLR